MRHTTYTDDLDHASDLAALYLDTRATHHFTPHVQSISSPQVYHGSRLAQLGNGAQLNIQHMYNGKISYEPSNFSLRNILHVPSLNTLLLSVQQFFKGT